MSNFLICEGCAKGFLKTNFGAISFCPICGGALASTRDQPRKSKYGNKKVKVGEFVFDSKKEAARYGELLLLEKVRRIANLEVHPEFVLVVNGVRICKYIGDFRYLDEDGDTVVEDVKSKPTRLKQGYRLKRKLMLAIHGIEIREVS